jgi:DNA-binding CsgD family transcriptional regulator
MSVSLTAGELKRLEAALQALLSPLDHSTLDEWRAAVSESLKNLVQADAALFAIGLAGSPTIYSAEYSPADFDEYARWLPIDEGVRRVTAEGIEAFTQTLIIAGDWRGYDRDPMVNEFYRPRRVHDAAGFMVGWPEEQAVSLLELHRERTGTELFGEKGLTMLRLLLPPFKAGMQTYLRAARAPTVFAHSIDQLGQALQLADLNCRVLHETPALGRLLSHEPRAGVIREAMTQMVQAVVAVAARPAGTHKTGPTPMARALLREVVAGESLYRLHGVYLGGHVLSGQRAVAVTVERVHPEPLADTELTARFGLTRREIQVSRLMAAGRTNAEVARALGISLHTAERHSEHVLRKLHLNARTAVRAKLQEK